MTQDGASESVASSGQDTASGIFLVDKPVGLTSFAIVRKIRWLLGIKKVGHAGTLDPFATGVLIVCAGRAATRHVERFMAGRKSYTARLQLGVETETQDPEGKVVGTAPVPALTLIEIEAVLARCTGPQLQAPPPYSAAKHKGKPLYYYARKGITVEKEAKPIEVYSLTATHFNPVAGQLDIEVSCSRGTYIRVLAADIGRALGCGAHLVELRRTVSGQFTVEECLPGTVLWQEDALERLLAAKRLVEDAVDETMALPI